MTTMPATILLDPRTSQWTAPLPETAGRTTAASPMSGTDPARGSDDQASFLREMVRRLDGDVRADDTPKDLASLAARRLVASTFVEPIVRDARENSASTGRFAPGVAEQRFGHLMDRALADSIVSKPGFAGVASLERRLLDRLERQLAITPAEAAS